MVLINNVSRRLGFLFIVFLLIFFSGNSQSIPSGFNLVAYEGFNYASGSSLLNGNGGTGWTNSWTKSYQDRYLKTSTTGFIYTGLTTTGLKAEFDSACYGSCNQIASLSRSMPVQSEGVVYFQFISVFEASGGGGTPQIRLYDGTTYTGMIGAGGGSFLSIYSLSNNSSSTASLSVQNFVVVRIDYDLNKTEMWINPDLSTFNYSNPMNPAASILGFSPSFDRMDIYIRSGSIDEITVFSQTYVPTLNKNGRLSINANEQVNQHGALASSVGLSVNGKIMLSNFDGLTPETAGISAKQIKDDYASSPDGMYWIRNSSINGGTPFQIFADMTTDGGGWMLLNVGAGDTAAPEVSTLTSPDVLGYLPRTSVIELAKLCTDVQLRAGNSSTSYANKTTSTSPLAIGALQSTAIDVNGAGTWANGASSTFVVNSGSWLWAYCCPGEAVGWPRMYHSSNYTNGVHWFADLGMGRKHSSPRDLWFSTWIR